jgi:SAM-dependent methyltransferase
LEEKALKSLVAVKALFLQLSSFLLIFILLSFLSSTLQISFSVLHLLICHALCAALAAFLLRFDWWWVPIQFLFPLCAYFLSAFTIPPYIYFSILLMFSMLFWSTYRTQVPYYPSRSELLIPILELMVGMKSPRFIDVGSGLGGLLIKLADNRKDASFFGIEIAPLPWLLSRLRGRLLKSSVNFKFGDFYDLDFSDFDVIFCYLSPAAMPSIWAKVESEMAPGSVFLSYEFIVPFVDPDFSLQIESDGRYLHGWRI